MWNNFLLDPLKGKIDDDWLMPVVHGYMAQVNLSFLRDLSYLINIYF